MSEKSSESSSSIYNSLVFGILIFVAFFFLKDSIIGILDNQILLFGVVIVIIMWLLRK